MFTLILASFHPLLDEFCAECTTHLAKPLPSTFFVRHLANTLSKKKRCRDGRNHGDRVFAKCLVTTLGKVDSFIECLGNGTQQSKVPGKLGTLLSASTELQSHPHPVYFQKPILYLWGDSFAEEVPKAKLGFYQGFQAPHAWH